MDRKAGIAFLMKDGDLRCFSSHGSWTSDCAPVAWRLAYVLANLTGEPINEDTLDGAMSMVVNDHEDVRTIIREHGHRQYT